MIAVLRALLSDKELIIIDEGLAAIPKDNRERIENYLDSLNKTVIMFHTQTLQIWIEKYLQYIKLLSFFS